MAWVKRHPFPVSILIAVVLLAVVMLVFFVLFGEASGEGGVTNIP
jgi:hypothetical protein